MNMAASTFGKTVTRSLPKKMRRGFISCFKSFLGIKDVKEFNETIGVKEQLDFDENGVFPEKWIDIALEKAGGAEFLAPYQRRTNVLAEGGLSSKRPPKIFSRRYPEKALVPEDLTTGILLEIEKLTGLSNEDLASILGLTLERYMYMFGERKKKRRLHIVQVEYLAETFGFSRDAFFKKIGLEDNATPKDSSDSEKKFVPREITEKVLFKILEVSGISKQDVTDALGLRSDKFKSMSNGDTRLHIAHVELLAEECGFAKDDFFAKIGLGDLVSNNPKKLDPAIASIISKPLVTASERELKEMRNGLPAVNASSGKILGTRNKTPKTLGDAVSLDIGRDDLTRVFQAIQCGLLAAGELPRNNQKVFFLGFLMTKVPEFSPSLTSDGQNIKFEIIEGVVTTISITHLKFP